MKKSNEIPLTSIIFHKMKPSDSKFDECLFELRDLMHAKDDAGTISNIIKEN